MQDMSPEDLKAADWQLEFGTKGFSLACFTCQPCTGQESVLLVVWAWGLLLSPLSHPPYHAHDWSYLGTYLGTWFFCCVGTEGAITPFWRSIPWNTTALLPVAAGSLQGLCPKSHWYEEGIRDQHVGWLLYWFLSTPSALDWFSAKQVSSEFVPPAWSCQAAESLAVVRDSSVFHLHVQMQPGIPDCKTGHPWICEMVIVLYTQLKCNWIWCKYCSVGWPVPLESPSLLFQQNTSWAFRAQCSLQQGAGREWNNCLQTDAAYEGPPRFSSLFLTHNPFPQILIILLKNLVGESVSLTHVSWAVEIVQATVPRGIFLIFVAWRTVQ